MSQWGAQQRGYGGQPQGFGGPQQQWRNSPNPWGAPAGTQTTWSPQRGQLPQEGGYRGRPARGGASNALRWLIMAIGAIIAGMVMLSLLNQTGTSAPTSPPAEYQNENYQVPPINTNPPEIPVPKTYGEATDWLEVNPIYNASVATPVRCEALPIDLLNSSNAALEQHFNELTGCLMRVFGPSLESAGFIPVRPSVTVYNQPVNTRCGSMPTKNAAYCSADQQVYYASDLPMIIPPDLRNTNYAVESVIAHEFAHAIQARTGILISSAAWEQNSNEQVANEYARRLEVQADCWTGQFIGSVGYSVGVDEAGINEISRLFYSIGDDVLTGDPNFDGNHGRGANRQGWFMEGSETTSMGACNAFTAPADAVR